MCHQILYLCVCLVISCPVLPLANIFLTFTIDIIFSPNLYIHEGLIALFSISNIWHFFAFNSISYVLIHSYILFISFCTPHNLCDFLSFLIILHYLQTNLFMELLTPSVMSFTYTNNIIGAKTDPCSTTLLLFFLLLSQWREVKKKSKSVSFCI